MSENGKDFLSTVFGLFAFALCRDRVLVDLLTKFAHRLLAFPYGFHERRRQIIHQLQKIINFILIRVISRLKALI